MELNNIVLFILSIPELMLHGSRGMTTAAGNSSSSGSKRIAPPKLCKDVPYRSWKNKLLMWKLVCNVDVKEQGIIVLLQSLNGNKKAEKAVSSLNAEMLYSNNGLNILLEKLDAVFQSEEIEDACHTYLKFSSCKHQPNMSMNDFFYRI